MFGYFLKIVKNHSLSTNEIRNISFVARSSSECHFATNKHVKKSVRTNSKYNYNTFQNNPNSNFLYYWTSLKKLIENVLFKQKCHKMS